MRPRVLLPVLLLSLFCLGFGKKKPELTIRFYTETPEQDTSSFAAPLIMLNGQPTHVDLVAALAERDILAIYPFTAADGTAGCALKLDAHGTIALDTLTVSKRGTLLIATINERQVADILIDARVTDGIITIPAGIRPAELEAMKKKFPILGQPSKKELKNKKRGKSKYDDGLI